MKPSVKTRNFAIGALLVAAAAFVAITTGGIGENLVYYWGPKELREAGNKAVGATIRTSRKFEAETEQRLKKAIEEYKATFK